MATNTYQEESNKKVKKNMDDWKFPKIPIDKIYKQRTFRIFPSYTIKEFQETLALKPTNVDVSYQLITRNFLNKFVKNQHRFLHLGLVQISIKPLMRDGLGSSIIVCIEDGRHVEFKSSILAMVESDLSEGPFYFNCFPSFSVSLTDASTFQVLNINVKTSTVPLALTYRIVCKAMVDLSSEALEVPILGETRYFQAYSGEPKITKWDDVEVPESWIKKVENNNQVTRDRAGSFSAVQFPHGRVMWRVGSNNEREDDIWEKD